MTIPSPFPEPAHSRPRALAPVLAAAATLLAAALVVRWLPSRPAPPAPPDAAEAAREYLRGRKPDVLSGPLRAILADPMKRPVPSQPHALVGRPAPAFSLPDVDGHAVALEDLLRRGPVVLIFYYGYWCDHCVSQLFDLNEDLRYFRELGATVVAASPDPAADTRAKYAKFGAFGFPVVSDEGRAVAARYGVFRPAVGGDPEWQAHGTFVIGRDGTVRWAHSGDDPFVGNPTLLAELARGEGRLLNSGGAP